MSSAALGAFDDAQLLVGFAEASLRNDYVDGWVKSTVAFLDRIFVDHAARRTPRT